MRLEVATILWPLSVSPIAVVRMFRYTLDRFGRKHVADAFKKAGLTFSGFHAFRHGLATNLFELGLDDLNVMRILRHASVQITRASYIKVRDHVIESAMARLSEAAKQSENGLTHAAAGAGSR